VNYLRLSHIISEKTPSYGNRDKIIIRTNSSIRKGETANSSCWIFSNNHIGTHIDSPYHFSEKGKRICDYPIEDFIFSKIKLIDVTINAGKLIKPNDLAMLIDQDIELLLIRTGYEEYRQLDKYWNDNPGLAPELADYFRKQFPKLRCVGFDFISLTSWNYRKEGRESHKQFLCPDSGEREILIIEDMSLKNINSELTYVIVAPLFIEDGNGGAVTIFAKEI
jgi:arylformamidase